MPIAHTFIILQSINDDDDDDDDDGFVKLLKFMMILRYYLTEPARIKGFVGSRVQG